MSKYSLECKIKVVKEYLDGKSGGIELIARKYNIPFGTVRNWINWFNANGIDGLRKKQSNNKYTGEFKLSVIKYRQINNLSYREAAENFCLVKNCRITKKLFLRMEEKNRKFCR